MLTRTFAAVRSVLYASGFVLLWAWVVASVRPFDDRMEVSVPASLRAAGPWVAAAGAVLALWCIAAFALVGKGTPAPFDAPREFVAVGPYRWVRNPMYLGAAGVILGAGLILGSPSALAVVPFFLVVTHAFVVLYEEPTLERRFGESYRRYRRSVNRWIPRPPKATPE
jgi:protein-S-isoprenylcysteine O-methyltransferase Ste14